MLDIKKQILTEAERNLFFQKPLLMSIDDYEIVDENAVISFSHANIFTRVCIM